eukprot:2020981-Pleurochrysis_carterae.AAC.3
MRSQGEEEMRGCSAGADWEIQSRAQNVPTKRTLRASSSGRDACRHLPGARGDRPVSQSRKAARAPSTSEAFRPPVSRQSSSSPHLPTSFPPIPTFSPFLSLVSLSRQAHPHAGVRYLPETVFLKTRQRPAEMASHPLA